MVVSESTVAGPVNCEQLFYFFALFDLYDSAWLSLASFSLEVQFCEIIQDR
jgi:hypothetical protein